MGGNPRQLGAGRPQQPEEPQHQQPHTHKSPHLPNITQSQQARSAQPGVEDGIRTPNRDLKSRSPQGQQSDRMAQQSPNTQRQKGTRQEVPQGRDGIHSSTIEALGTRQDSPPRASARAHTSDMRGQSPSAQRQPSSTGETRQADNKQRPSTSTGEFEAKSTREPQRDRYLRLTMPELGASLQQSPQVNVPRLRLDVINLRGVTLLPPINPAPPPWLSQTPTASQQSRDEFIPLWLLELPLQIDPDPDSELARFQKQQEVLEYFLSGAEVQDTPLAWRLSNTAVNLYATTPGGQDVRRRLGLEDVTILLNPPKRLYGVIVTFRFR